MTIEFQTELIKFLAQMRECKQYLPIMSSDIFDIPEHKVLFGLLQSFWVKYNSPPTLASLLEYLHVSAATQKLDKPLVKSLEAGVRKLYTPIEAHTTQIRESILSSIQYKKTQILFKDNFDKLNDGIPTFLRIRKEMDDIIRLPEKLEGNVTDPKLGFLFRAHADFNYKALSQGMPTFLNRLNSMTSAGGFKSPQLVIFMAAPKSFKTGTMLNVVMPYARQGKKIYYADLENGESAIKMRMLQYMAEMTSTELSDKKNATLIDQLVNRYQVRGGDVYVKSYQAHVSTTADIEADLDYLAEEFGWIPDIIAIDYADLMKPNDPKITEKRFKIQAVYFDIKNMNVRRNTLTFSLSQVSRAAVDKKVINMQDFAEDFGKAANCDASFALCQTKEERKAKVIRIIPVVQREGIQYEGTIQDTCFVTVDYAKQRIYELEVEQAMELLDNINIDLDTVKVNPKTLRDE